MSLPKFNSSPLKSYGDPIGKACLPTTIFLIFQGRAVTLQGCKCIDILSDFALVHCLGWLPLRDPIWSETMWIFFEMESEEI